MHRVAFIVRLLDKVRLRDDADQVTTCIEHGDAAQAARQHHLGHDVDARTRADRNHVAAHDRGNVRRRGAGGVRSVCTVLLARGGHDRPPVAPRGLAASVPVCPIRRAVVHRARAVTPASPPVRRAQSASSGAEILLAKLDIGSPRSARRLAHRGNGPTHAIFNLSRHRSRTPWSGTRISTAAPKVVCWACPQNRWGVWQFGPD